MLSCSIIVMFGFFFFKQKTAYEMRISDWSSDVCSSDLLTLFYIAGRGVERLAEFHDVDAALTQRRPERRRGIRGPGRHLQLEDRKSVVSGKSVSVCVDLGGRRIIKKKRTPRYTDKCDFIEV